MRLTHKKMSFVLLFCAILGILFLIFSQQTEGWYMVSLLGLFAFLYAVLLVIITWQDKKERKVLKEERDYLGKLLNSIPLPVFIIMPDKKIEFVNDASFALLEKGKEDLIGGPGNASESYMWNTSKCAFDLMAVGEAVSTDEKIQKELATKGIVSFEHKMCDTSGNEIWISLHGSQSLLHGEMVDVWMLMDITMLKESQREIKISEERYRIATQNTEDIIIDFDIQTKVMFHTNKATELFGVKERVENVPQGIIDYGIIGEVSIPEFLEMFDKIIDGVPKVSCNIQVHSILEKNLWRKISFTTIFDGEGRPVRAIGIIRDITDEVRANKRYKEEVQFWEAMMQDVSLHYEANLTLHKFTAGHELLVSTYGQEPTDDFDTVVQLLLKYMVYPPDRKKVWQNISWESVMKAYEQGCHKLIFDYRRNLGKQDPAWVQCTVYFLLDEETKDVKARCQIRDINETKNKELALLYKAERDLLTGLYNKITTENLIKKRLEQFEDNGKKGAFFLIDLDNFKNINDTLGHSFGDAVLSDVSQKFSNLFEDIDIVGRIGGDEFVAYMTCINVEEEAKIKAQKLCEMFHSAYTGMDNHYKVSGSVGISLFPKHGKTFGEIYVKADTALYASKESGKDTFTIYNDNLPQIGGNENKRQRNIDPNAGKVFAENIIEYVVRILYESRDVKMVASAILELVSKHFHFDRGYIIQKSEEEEYWNNTFEWCADGLSPKICELQKIPASVMEDYISCFDESGMHKTNDQKGISKELLTRLQINETQTLVHYALEEENVIKSLVCFDKCYQSKEFSADELSILHTISMLLATFLSKNNK